MITYRVTFFESTVLLDEMKIIPSDDDRSLHFHLSDNASQDATSGSEINKLIIIIN